jgi:uncharacterized membrane protein YccC
MEMKKNITARLSRLSDELVILKKDIVGARANNNFQQLKRLKQNQVNIETQISTLTRHVNDLDSIQKNNLRAAENGSAMKVDLPEPMKQLVNLATA